MNKYIVTDTAVWWKSGWGGFRQKEMPEEEKHT